MGVIKSTNRVFVGVDKNSGKLLIKDKTNPEIIDGIEGRLEDIRRSQTTMSDGTEIDKLSLLIQDDQLYEVQFGFNSNAAHNIINSYLSAEKLYNSKVLIRSYKKEGFNRLYLELNNQKPKWKFDVADIPQVKTKTTPSGKVLKDDSEKTIFFEEQFNTLLQKFNKDKKQAIDAEQPF